jgi:hypothetical protein
MLAILPADPLAARRVDPAYASEAEAFALAGATVAAVDHDLLEAGGDPRRATRLVQQGNGAAIYRGWMLRASAYRALHGAMAARDLSMATGPREYEACHHYPDAHASLSRWMARSTWLPEADIDDPAAVARALAPFGNGPVVIKDWVKSQSAYWDEACYVPDASDANSAARVTARFRELQGRFLCGGIVFREFRPLADEPEWRAFALAGRPLGTWPRSSTAGEPPPDGLLHATAAAVASPFASLDFAHCKDGRWLLLEAGDGQVSEFPSAAAMRLVVDELAAHLALPETAPGP